MQKDANSKRKHFGLSRAYRKKLLDACGYFCAYCDCDLTLDTCEADHFVPFSFKRTTKFKNMLPACKTCNQIKTNRLYATDCEARDYIQSERLRLGLPTMQNTLPSDSQMAEILHPTMSDVPVVSDAETRARSFFNLLTGKV